MKDSTSPCVQDHPQVNLQYSPQEDTGPNQSSTEVDIRVVEMEIGPERPPSVRSPMTINLIEYCTNVLEFVPATVSETSVWWNVQPYTKKFPQKSVRLSHKVN
jgi:hypothetical protein